jgi:DNA-binding NarL/FixJ family response regulator
VLRGAAKVFLLEPDGIYRLGMVACLRALPEIEAVGDAGTAADAWASPELADTDLVVLALDVERAAEVVGQLLQRVGCRVLVSARAEQLDGVRAAIGAGAVGVVRRGGLSSDALAAHVRAALHGAGLVPPELLTSLAGAGPALAAAAQHDARHLTDREQSVLSLFAAGKITREVARELAYSERTVKSVLHEAVTKLGASSRSQAIALAVRDGMI